MIEAARQWLATRPRARLALLTLYYFAIVAALAAMYGRGNFETPEFVYQEF
ncbi:MAG: teichoic acid D-Ala incorporation-associated protein DltX [Chthoniobacteraceae bacterium]